MDITREVTMKKKMLFIKKFILVLLLVYISSLYFSLTNKAHASDTTTELFYMGYSSGLSRTQLKDATNTIKFIEETYENNSFTYQSTGETVSESNPMITVLTHGYGGSNLNWSNDFPFYSETDKKEEREIEFTYDPTSIIERLREVTNGEVYSADVNSENNFQLFKLQLTKTTSDGNTISLVDNYNAVKLSFENNNKLSEDEFGSIQYSETYECVDQITDISKHIIIVFNTKNTKALNDVVYGEFDYMLDKIVYDVKVLNNGILPKINLVSHSRGGITNMQYALEHPSLVDSICTLGSPFLGSHLGQSEKILEILKIYKTKPEDGAWDIVNETKYNGYKNRWNRYYNELYSNINFHAIGGYSSIDFLNYMILKDAYMGKYDVEWLPALFTFINSNRPLENIVVTLGKATQYLHFEGDYEKYRFAVELICDNICIDNIGDGLVNRLSIKDDLFIDLNSQLANGYTGVIQYAKKFKTYNTDLTKLSTDDVAIVHNLEARDAELIDYIIRNMNYSSGNTNQYITELKSDGSLIIKRAYFISSLNNEIIIPNNINGRTVSEIGDYAFSNLNVADGINKVTIPATIKKIGIESFYNCSFIETVNFEQNSQLSEISDGAFANCTNLNTINLPPTVTKISTESFKNCSSLISIDLPTSLTTLEVDSFANCENLNSITIPSINGSFKTIDNVVYSKDETKLIFYPCGKNDSTLTVSPTTTEILTGAIVNNYYLTTIDLANTRVLRAYSIINCQNLANVIGTRIESVYEGALNQTYWLDSKNTNAILGTCLIKYNMSENRLKAEDLYNVKTIGSDAFYNSDIIEIVLPENIEQINPSSFTYSSNLNKVTILGNPYIFNNSFDYVSKDLVINVKYGVYDDYCSNTNLSKYFDMFNIISTKITLIDDIISEQNLYYGEEYSLPTSNLNGYTKNWYDQNGIYYAQTGIWHNLNSEVTLTASIEENVKFVNENGSVLYQCNLINGDRYSFDNRSIYVNGEVVHTLSLPRNYYQYEYYINNESVIDGTYDKSFTIIVVKEKPIIYEIKIYRYNPYHAEAQYSVIYFTYEDIEQNDIEHFYAGDYKKYTFDGLFIDASKTIQLIDPYDVLTMSEKVLYAKWSVITYEVIFNYHDDNNSYSVLTVSALDNIITLPRPQNISKEHHYASCWQILPENKKYEFNTEYEVVSNTEITLKWELIKYIIVYKNLNGAVNSNNSYYTYGMSFRFNSPVLNGHTFMGWYTDNTFTTPISSVSNTDSGKKVLYAKWKKVSNSLIRSSEQIITDDGKMKQHYDIISINSLFGMSAEELYNKNYREIKLTLNLRIWEIDDGYQHIYLYNGFSSNAKELYKKEGIEHGGVGKDGTKKLYTFTGITINVSDLIGSNEIYVRYDASGRLDDDWGNSDLSVEMSTTQVNTELHEYLYTSLGSKGHRVHCACGESFQTAHVVSSSSTGNRFVKCLFCEYILDLGTDTGLVRPFNLDMYYTSENGSYILPSGVIVLVDEDINAFVNCTLVFNKNDNNLEKA